MSMIEATAPAVKSTSPMEPAGAAARPPATGLASTAVHRFLVNGERPTRAEWDAEIAEADALVENQGPYKSASEWPSWVDDMAFTIDPDADEGERLTLLGFLEAHLAHFRAIDSDAAALVAEAIGDLVAECRVLGCPADASTFHARRDAMLAHRD